MGINKIPVQLWIGLCVAVAFGVAIFLRVYLPYDYIFTSLGVKFNSVDAYFQMRIVDNLIHNFPHLLTFDPYIIYPGGGNIGAIHFFDQFIGGVIWALSLGSADQAFVDKVGALFPAILGALTLIPAYFIGKELFGRWAGVLGAGLIAVMPGEFLGRSVLGYTDQHVAEVLFSSLAMMFLIMGIRSARQRLPACEGLKTLKWREFIRPLIYSVLGGLFLTLYILTWTGALLFVFIIAVFLIIQSIINHLRSQSSDYLSLAGFAFFLVPLVILGSQYGLITFGSLIIALLIPIILNLSSRLLKSRKMPSGYYPLALVVIALVGLGIFYAIAPSLLKTMFAQFSFFYSTGSTAATTLEMQPIFTPTGTFTWAVVWGNFTTNFFISIISLVLLIYLVAKRGNDRETIIVVWSLVMLAAAIGQRRFAYYYALNAALLTGYFSWLFLQFIVLLVERFTGRIQKSGEFQHRFAALPELTDMPAIKPPQAPEGKPAKMKTGESHPLRYAIAALAVIIVFLFGFVPNLTKAVATSTQANFVPTDGWQSSLTWLRDNSPDPFGNPDFYYQSYQSPAGGQAYQYPPTAYGVTAWWDYGYWITRIARRMPSANPGQTPDRIQNVANFFLATDNATARALMKTMDSRYTIIDYTTTTTKLWAIANWAGKDQTAYFDTYYVPYNNQLQPVALFYPEYYNSLVCRLYNFDGKEVQGQMPLVVSYVDKVQNGSTYHQITEVKDFTTYQEALVYKNSLKSTNARIVGQNAFISPIHLDAVPDFKLVYSSQQTIGVRDISPLPEVKIFEYTGGK